jgi:bifunctional DNA-binding transcriptional regulator/antitoxin component of YhaV-PrlF toxin-antitoxin module
MPSESVHVDHIKIGSGYRTVLPPCARERFGLLEGDELIAEVDAFGIHLYSLEQAARRSAALLAPYLNPGRSLSEELLRDRRDEARRE